MKVWFLSRSLPSTILAGPEQRETGERERRGGRVIG